MKKINYDDIPVLIKETLEEVKLSLNDSAQLKTFKKMDVTFFVDQICEEYNQGSTITKQYIQKCILATIKNKNLE